MTAHELEPVPPAPAGKVYVDLAEMTLRDLSDVGNVLAPTSLVDAIQGPRMADAMAALAWIVRRREDPTFTLDDAFALRMGDIELANAGAVAGTAPPLESQGVNDGATPRPSLESGESTRSA